MNRLMFGDCLVWLRMIDPDSVDLIYLDPPFNSDRVHNVLFVSPSGERNAQNLAFTDTWSWGEQSASEYTQLLNSPNTNVAETMRSFRQFLGDSDVMAIYHCSARS